MTFLLEKKCQKQKLFRIIKIIVLRNYLIKIFGLANRCLSLLIYWEKLFYSRYLFYSLEDDLIEEMSIETNIFFKILRQYLLFYILSK